MKMAGKILAGVSLLLALTGLSCGPSAETDSREVSLPPGDVDVATPPTNRFPLSRCHFRLARMYYEDQFTAIISFVLSAEHRPEGLRILRNPAEISEAQFRACLAEWTFPTIPAGTQINAAFRFETGAGWRYMRLSAEAAGFFEEIPMEGSAPGAPPRQ